MTRRKKSIVLGSCLAMVAILFLAWEVVVAVLRAKSAAMVMMAKSESVAFATAMKNFREKLSGYPTNLNELTWNSAGVVFLEFRERKPQGTNDGKFIDPWGRRYVYVPPANGATGYVASFGADGIPGGVDGNADQFTPLAAHGDEKSR